MITFRTCCTLLIGAIAVAWPPSPAAAQTQMRPKSKAQTEQPLPRPPVKKSNVAPVGNEEAAPKKARPKTQELKIAPLPPELEQLLKDWEQGSAKIKTLVGEHKRIVYNKVFEVEKWAEGKFYYESPDKGRIDLEGLEPKKGDVSRRFNEKTGQPYKLEAEQQTKWICTGQEILNINDDDKTFEAYPLPQELQGTNIIHGPLPFLFGMKAEEAKRRFAISYEEENNPKKNNDNVVWIKAVPRQMADKDNFQVAVIILDRKRYLPHAVKLLDPSGNLETVYTFPEKTLHVNRREMIPELFRTDPFHPRLGGYKMIPQQVAAPGDSKSDNSGPPKIRQASNATDGGTSAGSARPKTTQSTKTGTTTRPK